MYSYMVLLQQLCTVGTTELLDGANVPISSAPHY